jgi:hypothetical protein
MVPSQRNPNQIAISKFSEKDYREGAKDANKKKRSLLRDLRASAVNSAREFQQSRIIFEICVAE